MKWGERLRLVDCSQLTDNQPAGLGSHFDLREALRTICHRAGGCARLAMARYLEVAQAELDNNSTEHSLRGVVLGRRNWLHVGQEAGGEKAANLFSLMITCKRLGVEPYAYLDDILRRLPSHPNKDIWQLTPRGWRETFAPKTAPPGSSG